MFLYELFQRLILLFFSVNQGQWDQNQVADAQYDGGQRQRHESVYRAAGHANIADDDHHETAEKKIVIFSGKR